MTIKLIGKMKINKILFISLVFLPIPQFSHDDKVSCQSNSEKGIVSSFSLSQKQFE